MLALPGVIITVNPPLHTFAHHAMTTCWVITLAHDNRAEAGGICQEMFREIDRLEDELSRFRDSSSVARIGFLQPGKFHPLSEDAFECLKTAQEVWKVTGGAFDVTIGPLMDAPPGEPSAAPFGMDLLELDEDDLAVRVHAGGLLVDLGGIGKGYALDCLARILDDYEVKSALLNAGGSTILALDPPPGMPAWEANVGGDTPKTRVEIPLHNRALSASGLDVKGQHIVDPRTKRRIAPGRARVHVLAPTAAQADAFSTAFMVMDDEEIEEVLRRRPDVERAR